MNQTQRQQLIATLEVYRHSGPAQGRYTVVERSRDGLLDIGHRRQVGKGRTLEAALSTSANGLYHGAVFLRRRGLATLHLLNSQTNKSQCGALREDSGTVERLMPDEVGESSKCRRCFEL